MFPIPTVQKIHSQLVTSGSETAFDNTTGKLNPYGESFVRKGRTTLEGNFAVLVFNIFNSCQAFRVANGPSVGFNSPLACFEDVPAGGGGGSGGKGGGGSGRNYVLPGSLGSSKSTAALKAEAAEQRNTMLRALCTRLEDRGKSTCGVGELGAVQF